MFINHKLEFHNEKIVDTVDGGEVMMDWESDMMKKSAEYICHNKGDILEVGFGMGISANYIQSNNVKSHTILEIHPQILEKLYIWAKDKPNVTIIEKDWDMAKELPLYDGILFDTYNDLHLGNFKSFALSKIKPDGKITYFNPHMCGDGEHNLHDFNSITFTKIPVKPDDNSYFSFNTYFMPMVEANNNIGVYD